MYIIYIISGYFKYLLVFCPQVDPYLCARNASRIFLRELNTQRYLVLCRNKGGQVVSGG
jgi:hypothetical protein